MSKIDELIAELCPNGVEFKTLKDIARIRNGKDYKNLGDGVVPVYGTGGIMKRVNTAAYNKPSVLIPRKGSLNKLYYVEEPFWTVDTIFYTEINSTLIEPKFFYYFLVTQRLEELNQAGGVPSLTQTVLNEIRIPVPPLEVQREIVKVLDTFTKLEAELEAELEARRRQYAYYRDALLTFGEQTDANASKQQIRWTTLGESFNMRAGQHISALQISDNQDSAHAYPCYGGNGIRGFVERYSHDGAHLLIGRQGALCGNVQRARGKFYATEHAVVVTPVADINTDWAFHMLTIMNLNQYASKSAQPGLAVGKLEELPIAIPSPEEQERIVAILDKFDALVNDLNAGLPAELHARRKQYEHYRDRLLTFKEAA